MRQRFFTQIIGLYAAACLAHMQIQYSKATCLIFLKYA